MNISFLVSHWRPQQGVRTPNIFQFNIFLWSIIFVIIDVMVVVACFLECYTGWVSHGKQLAISGSGNNNMYLLLNHTNTDESVCVPISKRSQMRNSNKLNRISHRTLLRCICIFLNVWINTFKNPINKLFKKFNWNCSCAPEKKLLFSYVRTFQVITTSAKINVKNNEKAITITTRRKNDDELWTANETIEKHRK